MNTRRFLYGSSIILAGWLGATFLYEVPAQRYPKLDKKTAATPLTPEATASAVATAEAKSTESVAH
ncbi:MAG TPA: hypothetical protein VF258_07765 [Luteolibacter sp.]